MGKIKKVLLGVINILLVIGIVFGVGLLFDKYVNQSIAPTSFGITPLLVETGSMEPEIRAGSVVVSKKTKISQLKKGNVISFYEDSEKNYVVTHRISDINRSGDDVLIETKGDANNTADSNLISQDMIIGKVVFESYLLGQIYIILSAGFMIPLILLTIAGILYFDAVRKEKKEKELLLNNMKDDDGETA